ncbi:MAG: transketolase [Gammaproteobacteria bacterium]|nr:transketolase [Gammaproteobacteria bacterium]
MHTRLERANAIRALAMDAVQQANSGHPGAPMGLADIAEVLWQDVLRYNPANPNWHDRDRFVLSNGHASMLLYAVLHLTGYDVTIDDIRNFRQLHSKTAGHPEYGECPGIETTTGPLGQGLANAVGMALAERELATAFNRDEFDVVNHRTWACVGEGCLMEGISHEAASLAGTLKLGKLIVLFDRNNITIDGDAHHWFTENVANRFEAYGWRVLSDVDGHDPAAIAEAFAAATARSDQPTLIDFRTVIGYGAPNKKGTASAHGSPLGNDEIALVRERLAWSHEPFKIPASLYEAWNTRNRGSKLESAWNDKFEAYARAHPELASELSRRLKGELPVDWFDAITQLAKEGQAEPASLETRKASGQCLDLLGPEIPELFGGSADLTGSNNTQWDGAGWLWEGGRYMNYGVREFGMTAIANGMALHGGFIPYTGTFLVFMEYARNAVRLASLIGLRHILVYTHDSVGLGEDGPTHQPIEQLTNLRTTPNLSVWRPCDVVETAIAWREILQRQDGPCAIVLTRQKTQPQARDSSTFDNIKRGAYILRSETKDLELILIATGSEVEVAQEAADRLETAGTGVRVVSMPSVDRFMQQSDEYRELVLPYTMRNRVAIEAAHPDYWRRFVGLDGAVVGINRFGLSAPGDEVMRELGVHADAVVAAAEQLLA